MLPQIHSLPDLAAENRPGQSSCSSDTGGVLVRPTRVHLCDRRHELGVGLGVVPLTVQKLQDPYLVRSLSTRARIDQRPKQRQTLDKGVRRALVKNPGATKENRHPPTELSPDMKLCTGTDHGSNLLTSCFATGGRGVVLAALRQRFHSAPHRRQVKVQLLDPNTQDDAGLRISPQDAPRQGTSSQNAAGVAGLAPAPDATHAAAVAAAAAVSAAAPMIKAQSDMEARVSQLMDGVEKLLHADGDSGHSRWDFNQQTLKHLERLHSQQLQLHSQLLESALQVVTGHAPVTSTSSELRAGHQLDHLHITDIAANALCSKKQTASATRAASATAMETGTVAMVTPQGNGWTEQTRESLSKQGEPGVSKAVAHKSKGSDPQCAASDGREVERTASEALREIGRLKTLLTPEDVRMSSENLRPQESRSPPDQSQGLSQRLQSCHSVFQLCQNQSQPNSVQPQLSQYHQQQPNQNQSQPAQAYSRRFQSHQSLLQEIQSKYSDSQQAQSQHAQAQSQQAQAQSQHAQAQAQQAQAQSQHAQAQSQQAQAQSQQAQAQSWQAQSVPVKRRLVVPSMLEEAGQVLRQVRRQRQVLEENFEALLRANRGEVLHCQLEALAANRDCTNKVRIKKTVDAWISALTNNAQTDPSQRRAAVSPAPPMRRRPVSRGTGIRTVVGRGGRAQTAGSKVQGAEPDRVTGVIDSEQLDGESYLTRLYGRAPHEGQRRTLKKSPYLRFSSPASALGGKARPRLVERVQGVKVKSCKTQTLAPSAVGQRQHSFSSAHMKSSGAADIQSVPIAVPLGRRRVEASSRCRHAPPSASVVATDNGAPEQQSQNESDAGAVPPSHSVYIIERKSEEEDDVFPGSDLESVAHVQVAIETDPGPPPPVLYRGLPFPPQPLSAIPDPDPLPVLGLDRQRDVLENRLVEWIEQQLMSRMISEMYRHTASDPAQNVSPDLSESEEQSVTSDIVEAAGDAGLQLFVDSNIEVDSALIRQLVSEVLTETVSLLLGQRDLRHSEPEPTPAASREEVPLVPTPVPTPPPSPVPHGREATPLTTPPPSEQVSQLNDASLQPATARECIATPTSSPEPSPSAALHAPPPLTWGNAELPQDEEQPEAPLDPLSPPLVMSVAEEEPPLSSPDPPPLLSVPPAAPSPPPDSGPPSLSSSSEDCSSSSSSSPVTEAALKHISEGELLISVNLQSALTEDEAVCSFSSTLQDTEFDPLSEGQVRGQDLLLLTKMEQRLSHRGDRPQPEGSWGRQEEESVGEVRHNWTTETSRTTNPSNSTSAQRDETTSSPGQTSQCADFSDVSFDATSQGLVSMGGLMVEPLTTLTSDLQTELSLSPHSPHLLNAPTAAQVVPIQVKQINRRTESDMQPGGTKKMDVHLPSIRTEQVEESVSGAETSSTNDVF